MVNRYPAAGGQVPSPIDGNAICPLEKRTTDAKKFSFMFFVLGLLVSVCLSKWRIWNFFPQLQIFSAPELQVELFTIISRKTLT